MAHGATELQPASPEAIRLGYEPQSIRLRGLMWFMIVFVASMVVIWAVAWGVMELLLHHEERLDVPQSAIEDRAPPPEPRVQPSLGHDKLPYQDVEDLREKEDRMFHAWGWQPVAGAPHQVAIPDGVIERVQRDAQARSNGPTTAPTGNSRGVNTLVPGRPVYTHEPPGSPQGPTPNYAGDNTEGPAAAGEKEGRP